ncbi:DUF2975 domain-containing protein [Chelatococcus asaccharovorans]|uniref:DUF2975 domain-containing protein n=1 Tax=Chelatococcus asaccharovorans TaxID=28210 RepID=UPI00224C63A0|nr:DUF2975 domain-containing protein [Chelatococcus asaccharovorans]CAH1672694.1 conserved membrane hypothetical protein [Chelatococcus asaccharovorans]CAH1675905.1 conserved membrane hypothetical protein [Chelatococcus asaccharovorans]
MLISNTTPQASITPVHGRSLTRIASGLRLATVFGAVTTQCILAWVWLSPDRVVTFIAARLRLEHVPLALDDGSRALGFSISMVPAAVLFYALYQVYRLCDGLRRGAVSWQLSALHLQRIGWAMLAISVLRPLTNTFLSVVLTLANAADERHIVVALSTDDAMIAILGGLVLVLGRVMSEAGLIALENEQII